MNPLLHTARDPGIGQARGVPFALLDGDPREDAVGMVVLDDNVGGTCPFVVHQQRLCERL